jgi:Ran GTPase-activating protein (RanGAP) involved in mRNA processing and transport
MHEDNYEDPRFYFGDDAKEEFWDLYKSERRFKDYNNGVDEIKDPRFAYLQTCKELMVYPKARMLIREKKSNHIDYSNFQLLNKSAVAVAEAIKRYGLPVDAITLQNNGLKPKECCLLIQSFQRHYQQIQSLTIAKNKMGMEGAKYLATSLAEMKILSKLILNDNDIGDHGVAEILNSARNYCSVEILDVSGNNLGKSSACGELAESMYLFLSNNRTMEVLKMNWNSLRGIVADKIMEGLLECTGIREVYLNNNLLGVTYEDKQPPVNRLAEILQTLKHLE